MIRLFRRHNALALAQEQLLVAKYDLLMAEANAESYQYHAEGERARAKALQQRIIRLERATAQLKGERDEADS